MAFERLIMAGVRWYDRQCEAERRRAAGLPPQLTGKEKTLLRTAQVLIADKRLKAGEADVILADVDATGGQRCRLDQMIRLIYHLAEKIVRRLPMLF